MSFFENTRKPVGLGGQWHQPVSRLGISLGRIPAEAYFIPPGVV